MQRQNTTNKTVWAKQMARALAAQGLYAYNRQSNRFYAFDDCQKWIPSKIDSIHLGMNPALADETLTEGEIAAFEEEIKLHAKPWCPLPHEEMVPTDAGVIVRKGKVLQRYPHSKKWQFNYSLPYKKPAACPHFMAMLKDSMTVADHTLLQEYAGDIMWGQNKSNSVLLQLGEDTWTKKVVTHILTHLVGADNAVECSARKIPSIGKVMAAEMPSRTPATWILLHASSLPANFFSADTCQKIVGLTGASPLKHDIKSVKRHVVLNAKDVAPMEMCPAAIPLSSRTLVIQYNGKAKHTSAVKAAETLWNEEGEGIVTWAMDGSQMKNHLNGFSLTPEHYVRQFKLLGIK